MHSPIPDKTPLSGADYFNLLVDRNLRKLGYPRNIIHMALDLEGKVNEDQVRALLEQRDILSKINGIRLQHFPFAVPLWRTNERDYAVPVKSFAPTEGILPEAIFQLNLAPAPGKWLHISLIQISPQSTRVVLSAHHAIIDNRGMQMLVEILENGMEKEATIFPEKKHSGGVWQQLKEFNQARHFLMDADQRVAGLLTGRAKPDLKNNFSTVDFTEEETSKIDTNAIAAGARFGSGPFLIAAVARSVNGILTDRGRGGKTIWVPVPQDQRMRGGAGALLSNQISFMFYRIPNNVLGKLPETVRNISDQMMDQVRVKMPVSYATMMNIFRRMPMSVYNFFMKLPTKGVVTTFSFSDLGKALPDDVTLFGHRVDDVYHFPPNPVPPGFTVVCMRFKGRLRIITGSTSQAIDPAELVTFEARLRQDLLQENHQ